MLATSIPTPHRYRFLRLQHAVALEFAMLKPLQTTWSTACHADDSCNLALELSLLSEQMARCGCGRRWFALCCAAALLRDFVHAHLIGSGLLMAVLLGAAWSAL